MVSAHAAGPPPGLTGGPSEGTNAQPSSTKTVASQLRAAEPRSQYKRKIEKEFKGIKSKATFHIFANETDFELELCWFAEGCREKSHGLVLPKSHAFVGTYSFHKWRMKRTTGEVVAEYGGASAVVVVRSDLSVCVTNNCTVAAGPGASDSEPHPKWGRYRQRGDVQGMPVMAFDCVDQRAVDVCGRIVGKILERAHADVLPRMLAAGSALAVVGRRQQLTDMPPHAFMRFHVGRDVDASARGLGATHSVPLTSVGEENLLMDGDNRWPSASLLVHEFGHAVMSIGMTTEQQTEVCGAYAAAVAHKRHRKGCYMMVNEQEYWAAGVEAWFESTIREDVNSGMNTRARARQVAPELAALLEGVLGDGPWRYHHDCPAPLRHRRWKYVEVALEVLPAGAPGVEPHVRVAVSMLAQPRAV